MTINWHDSEKEDRIYREMMCKARGFDTPCPKCGEWPQLEETDDGHIIGICVNMYCENSPVGLWCLQDGEAASEVLK